MASWSLASYMKKFSGYRKYHSSSVPPKIKPFPLPSKVNGFDMFIRLIRFFFPKDIYFFLR